MTDYRKLAIGDEAPRVVRAVVELPRGVRVGWRFDPSRGTFSIEEHYARPVPIDYGWIAGTHNPADGEHLDVMIATGRTLDVGHVVRVVPLGVLRREDGDHKIMAAVAGEPGYRSLADVPGELIAEIERWMTPQHVLLGWEGAEQAQGLIREHRAQPETPGD